MKDFIFCLVLFFVSKGLYAQSHFPQTTMNGITQKKLAQKIDHKKDRLFNHSNTSLKSVTGVLNIIDALTFSVAFLTIMKAMFDYFLSLPSGLDHYQY